MAFSTETNFNSRCATDAPGRSCLLLRRAQFEHKTRLGQQFLPLSVLIADKDGRRGSSSCSWRHNSTTMVLYRLGSRSLPRADPDLWICWNGTSVGARVSPDQPFGGPLRIVRVSA